MFHVKEKMSISCYILLLLLLCSSKIVYTLGSGYTGDPCVNDGDCHSFKCDQSRHVCLCGKSDGDVCRENFDCCGLDTVCLHKGGWRFGCCWDPSRKLSIEEAGKVSFEPMPFCKQDALDCSYHCQCCSGRCNRVTGICD